MRDRTSIMYKSIHDMESFMWVLIYLCLTRKGPGGERRDELCFDATVDDTTERAQTIVYCFFDSARSRISWPGARLGFLQTPGDMEEYVTSQFHPYFEALKPLVSEWWRILQRSYRFSEFTTIHDLFLAAIEKAIQGLPSTHADPDPDAAGKKRELDRRAVDLIQSLTLGTGAAGRSSNDIALWARSPDRVIKSVDGYRPGMDIERVEPPSSPTPPPKKARRNNVCNMSSISSYWILMGCASLALRFRHFHSLIPLFRNEHDRQDLRMRCDSI
jgi:hypothetical protein